MNLRGLFPSLGAGGSLIAAALCAFVVLGGVFVFRGESPGTAQAKPKDLALRAGAVRARTASIASPAPARTTPIRTATTRRAAARPRRRPAPPRGSSAPTPEIAAPPPASSSPGGTSSAPTPTPDATPAGTVTRVVRHTRAAAKPVIQAAPAPVQGPVNAAADTVEQTAGAVDGLLQR